MAMSNISATTNSVAHTYVPLSAPSGTYGTAIWREEVTTIPPMFRPTIEQSSKPNAPGTNTNCTLKVRVPVYDSVNNVSKNTCVATFSVSALQNVTGDAVAQAIDSMISALTARKTQLALGRTD